MASAGVVELAVTVSEIGCSTSVEVAAESGGSISEVDVAVPTIG